MRNIRPLQMALLLLSIVFTGLTYAQEETVARLFGQPVTLADITPDNKKLNEFARIHSISREMAIAQFRHGELADKIVTAVLDDYASAKHITVSEELTQAFLATFGEQLAENKGDNAKAPEEIAREQVRLWLIDKALYEQYGGTVIFRQKNPQAPVGAYEKVLKAYQDKGEIIILQDAYAAVFWEAFEPPFNFVISPENVDFSKPWWMR